jgi:hypothetical protein
MLGKERKEKKLGQGGSERKGRDEVRKRYLASEIKWGFSTSSSAYSITLSTETIFVSTVILNIKLNNSKLAVYPQRSCE